MSITELLEYYVNEKIKLEEENKGLKNSIARLLELYERRLKEDDEQVQSEQVRGTEDTEAGIETDRGKDQDS